MSTVPPGGAMSAAVVPPAVLRDVAGLPAGSRALLLPFDEPLADRFAIRLASLAVAAAVRQRRRRLVLAVCGACLLCHAYETAIAAATGLEGMATTLFAPAVARSAAPPATAEHPDPAAGY